MHNGQVISRKDIGTHIHSVYGLCLKHELFSGNGRRRDIYLSDILIVFIFILVLIIPVLIFVVLIHGIFNDLIHLICRILYRIPNKPTAR